MVNFKDLMEDYKINDEDDDLTYKLKKNLEALPTPSKNIFLLYLYYGTYTDVAKILKCSPPTCRKKINEIREELLK